jgi:hypothetical protein
MFNNDAGNQTAKFTLSVGDHTLEIAHRERGAKLDAIVGCIEVWSNCACI